MSERSKSVDRHFGIPEQDQTVGAPGLAFETWETTNLNRPDSTMPFLERMREDINSVLERDPAARSKLEILTCYPGLWAVWYHRVSHALWRARLRLLARMLSQVSRFLTGVDIHPECGWKDVMWRGPAVCRVADGPRRVLAPD